jgi:2-keto-3-deoxy-L-rhamnonate aldolase RhmA
MDIGAMGINFPMICSREDAEKAGAQRALPAARRPAVGTVSGTRFAGRQTRPRRPIGGAARTAEQANRMIERGYVALALGFDWSLFARGIAAAFEGIKR